VRALGEGLGGRLHIASVPTFAWSSLPQLLKAFAAQAPNVVVELSDPEPADVLRQVAAGDADVGFVASSDPDGLAAAHPQLSVAELLTMPLVAVVPPRLADLPEPVDLALLAEEPWILPTSPGFPGMDRVADSLWQDLGLHPRSVRYVSTLQTAVPLIAADMGVSLMPRAVADASGGRVLVRTPLQPVRPLYAVMVWARQLPPSPVLERFLAVARRTYTSEL